jgi:hypothetical protein
MTASKHNIVKGQPLVLPNGTVINKNLDGQTIIKTAQEQADEAELDAIMTDVFDEEEQEVPIQTYQRTLADIPNDVSAMKPVMLILAYSMWGLPADALSRHLDLPIEQIEHLMNTDLYVRMRKEMLESIRYAEASSIHGYLSAKALTAAKAIASRVSSKNDDIALAAAKDVLDRTGFRPADRTEHVHRFEDELRIVHLTQSTNNIDVGV